ncbi:hypothetical protein MMC20_006434 [Loxospora ochrophaea]|nr:hypothetical protein [Loxospora ochrophaea]
MADKNVGGPRRCHLFRLPAELRNRIYRLALTASKVYPIGGPVEQSHVIQCARHVNESYTSRFSLLLTCRRIHEEAYEIFYNEAVFVVIVSSSNIRFLSTRKGVCKYGEFSPPSVMPMIRNLRIEVIWSLHPFSEAAESEAWNIRENIRTLTMGLLNMQAVKTLHIVWKETSPIMEEMMDIDDLDASEIYDVAEAPDAGLALEPLGNLRIKGNVKILHAYVSDKKNKMLRRDRIKVKPILSEIKSDLPSDFPSKLEKMWMALKGCVMTYDKAFGGMLHHDLDDAQRAMEDEDEDEFKERRENIVAKIHDGIAKGATAEKTLFSQD